MLSLLQAIILGLLQGVTELFPISSLGHSIVFPHLLGWHINQADPFFLSFIVATHTATAIVLLGFFWKDWVKIAKGFLRSVQNREITNTDTDGKLAWLLIVTTIPAGLIGVLFQDQVQSLFANPRLVAFVLILNGLLLFLAEFLRRRRKEVYAGNNDQRIAKLTFVQGIKVGILQCIALIPGFSRTGATMTGGLLVGLSHEDAARFSFLLATPIIAAAAFLKLPEINIHALPITLIGAIAAGITAYLSVQFLTKYFQKSTLLPFAFYCMSFGVLLSLLFLWR